MFIYKYTHKQNNFYKINRIVYSVLPVICFFWVFFFAVIEDRVPNIRLCFSYRNFMPGEYIYDNITHAVQNSKKTVLVLSKYVYYTFMSNFK